MSINPQQPSPEIQRRIIEQKRDQFRAEAFGAEIEMAAVAAQTVGVSDEERERTSTELANKAANCYAAAKKMDDLLKALPKPKDPKKKE